MVLTQSEKSQTKVYATSYSKNLSNTWVSLSTKASAGTVTNVIASPAARARVRRRGIARASAGVNNSGMLASTGSPV